MSPYWPAQVTQLARELRTKTVVVYVSRRPLKPGSLELRVGETPIQPHPEGSWVIFIDEVPTQSWAHRCRYIVIDPDGTQREASANWFPRFWHMDFERIGPSAMT